MFLSRASSTSCNVSRPSDSLQGLDARERTASLKIQLGCWREGKSGRTKNWGSVMTKEIIPSTMNSCQLVALAVTVDGVTNPLPAPQTAMTVHPLIDCRLQEGAKHWSSGSGHVDDSKASSQLVLRIPAPCQINHYDQQIR